MRGSAQEAVPLKDTWFVNWTHWSDIKIMYTPKKKERKEDIYTLVMNIAKTNLALTCTVYKNFKFVVWRVYQWLLFWLRGDYEINGYMTSL